MEGEETAAISNLTNGNPDRLQQILIRLHRHYEDMKQDKQRVCVMNDLNRMIISESDRRELLRRLDRSARK